MKIITKDANGKPNGAVTPLWSAIDAPELRPDQVYLTTVAPGTRKGAHLHRHRRGMFFVVYGSVRIRSRFDDAGYHYTNAIIAPGDAPVIVHPGVPCAIYNHTDLEAAVLNMPSPAWSEDEPDEWPVEDWEDPAGWGSPQSTKADVIIPDELLWEFHALLSQLADGKVPPALDQHARSMLEKFNRRFKERGY